MTDLDRRLAELAQHLDWPEPTRPVEHPSLRPTHSRRVTVAVAIAAAMVAVVLVIPSVRDRVAAFFGLGAVDIVQGVLLEPSELLLLGISMDPSDLDVELPPALSNPDDVRIDPSGVIWLVFDPRPGLESGALLAVFPGRAEAGLTKLVADHSLQVEQVTVAGQPALWVDGGDHFILFPDERGEMVEDRGRLSANALIWITGDITYRLEADVPLEVATRLAEP
jgi:hypothetical protein